MSRHIDVANAWIWSKGDLSMAYFRGEEWKGEDLMGMTDWVSGRRLKRNGREWFGTKCRFGMVGEKGFGSYIMKKTSNEY